MSSWCSLSFPFCCFWRLLQVRPPPPQGFAGQRGAQVPLSHGAMCIGSRVRRERAPGVSLAAAEPGALGSSGGGGPMGGPRAMDLRGVCK